MESKDSENLDGFAKLCNLSLLSQLTPDPQSEKFAPNKVSREVLNGHYVPVLPTPLPHPKLVSVSPAMAKELGLSHKDIASPTFLNFFSGHQGELPCFKSWATPYALSIYGQEMYQNCPFGNGNGYGDGRAISIAEVSHPQSGRWEFQLKGAGTTPFCRGGDGRAVLRSSVREFLVSEAMHQLGVSTTRALSLVVSQSETVKRAWYSNSQKHSLPSLDDPRLAHLPAEMRPQLIQYLHSQLKDPDTMVKEQCATTCRVARSFLRVGQIELFGRRARNGSESSRQELETIANHLVAREYPEIDSNLSTQEKCLSLLRLFSQRLSHLTADWLRVGYCQGNFNSDNCLAGGVTMDYGPFGFMERFSPLWNMWSGGGEHFGFLNQPVAGQKNFASLAKALTPLLDENGQAQAQRIVEQQVEVSSAATFDMWCTKLGLEVPQQQQQQDEERIAPITKEVLQLMAQTEADYTILWRQLAQYPDKLAVATGEVKAVADDFSSLQGAFYKQLSDTEQQQWKDWLNKWLSIVQQQTHGEAAALAQVAQSMRRTNPKYVPREWMLVQAYSKAQKGDFSGVEQLQTLFATPYQEHPELEDQFYRKAPADTYEGAGKGGTAFMS
eukprot:CAMPEP_0175124308 /NCGR_PEP_ID=MMETSP0087-20121206/2710_1 /TAXON_ID=136419 /ORGANISM="Unknown Unknown, Strain D1" /LENGTH=611 /DNA_ID=CAMNT_0016406063 /DNA_START=161 /DNA_END=1996 /DNA_ORIENTATION=-